MPQRFGVTPDVITVAKGITNGSVPMGAVFVKGEIYEKVCKARDEKRLSKVQCDELSTLFANQRGDLKKAGK